MAQDHARAMQVQDTLGTAMKLLLWPGNALGKRLGIADPESRMLFRMFINLTVYGKVSVLIVLLLL